MSKRHVPSAVPGDSNAIRADFVPGDPDAVVFNDRASPGALVSWAWCQLSALQSLLEALIVDRPADESAIAVAESVLAIVGPARNALLLSEQRAEDLRGNPLTTSDDQPRRVCT